MAAIAIRDSNCNEKLWIRVFQTYDAIVCTALYHEYKKKKKKKKRRAGITAKRQVRAWKISGVFRELYISAIYGD